MNPSIIHRALMGIALSATITAGCALTARRGDPMNHAPADLSPQIQPVTSVLRAYEGALNRGDVPGITSLYAPDAVFMAQHRAPAVGQRAIETAYREILGAIRLDIRFEIDEVVVVSANVAWARTRSTGTTTILASDARVSEGNQELFVLVRDGLGGDWRIGRYIFSTTLPRRDA